MPKAVRILGLVFALAVAATWASAVVTVAAAEKASKTKSADKNSQAVRDLLRTNNPPPSKFGAGKSTGGTLAK